MAGGTTQAPASVYTLGGLPTLTNWEVHDPKRSFVEVAEDRNTPLGQHSCKLSYSMRETLSVRLVALAGASAALHTYIAGGTIASGVFTLADGSTATAWDIVSCEEVPTRGPYEVNLSLIQQGDKRAVT